MSGKSCDCQKCKASTEDSKQSRNVGGKQGDEHQAGPDVRSLGNLAVQRQMNASGGGDQLGPGWRGSGDNQEIQRLVKSAGIQRSLTVNEPGDSFEQEADRVADHVVNAPSSAGASPPAIQRMCPDCEEEELNRKESGEGSQIGSSAAAKVNSVTGSGHPLSKSELGFFEPRFNRSLDHVRIHTDSQAAEAASAVNARAYTRGEDIVFGTGEYQPETTEGKRLLAHEITHTIQQTGKGNTGGLQRTIGDGHDLTSPRFALDPVLEACFDNERVLQVGDQGTAVATVQHALVELGFLLPDFGIDGIFEAETRQGVMDFQTAQGLTGAAVDGVIGPGTMGLLDAAVPAGPAAGPAANPATPAGDGTAPTLSANVTTAATPGNCGTMNYVVTWQLSGNAGAHGGFVIQDITITWNEVDCAGNPVPDPQGHVSPLRYWEAWRVAPNSQTFSPVQTDTFSWSSGLATGCTVDTVTFVGVARYHDNVAALPGHMTAGNAATKAGGLQSSVADPNVGGNPSPPILHLLFFSWNCCNAGACNVTPTVTIFQFP
jgi:peptidoglycan hydrolase-like protein with peptidoglycan-binding domain